MPSRKKPQPKPRPVKLLYTMPPEVVQELQDIMQGEGIKTMTKAINACIMNMRRYQANIKDLRAELSRTGNEARENALDIRSFVMSLNRLLEKKIDQDHEEYQDDEDNDNYDDDDDI